MMRALEKREINGQLRTWIAHMLKNRKVTVYMGDCKATKGINRGTPQGGILSSTIFNVDTKDCLENTMRVKIQCIEAIKSLVLGLAPSWS